MMMDGDLDGAIEVFQQIEQKDPDSPLGYVLEANATWWKIYYVSANLIDPDVFDVANMEATPYDSHFDDLDSVAIHKAEARIHQHQDLARKLLYEGFAYALRARLDGLHDRDLPTARAGKKMRSLLLRALQARSQPYGCLPGHRHLQLLCRHAFLHRQTPEHFHRTPGRQPHGRSSATPALRGERRIGESGSEVLSGQGLFARQAKSSTKNPCVFSASCNRNFPTTPSGPCSSAAYITAWEDPQKGEEIYREVYQKTTGKNSEVDKRSTKPPAKPWNGCHPGQKFP